MSDLLMNELNRRIIVSIVSHIVSHQESEVDSCGCASMQAKYVTRDNLEIWHIRKFKEIVLRLFKKI